MLSFLFALHDCLIIAFIVLHVVFKKYHVIEYPKDGKGLPYVPKLGRPSGYHFFLVFYLFFSKF